MKYSLMTEPQLGGTYEEILAAARWAESVGMVSFARSDHYGWSGNDAADATDAFATLAGLARETDTIRLAVLVSPITFRHPAVIAKNAVTIDQMSGGRFDLGVGTGWMEAEHEKYGFAFPDRRERFARLEEALAYIEAAFGNASAAFDGKHYRLSGQVNPKPSGTRIVVGGSGPTRTPTLAGRHADEYNHSVAAPDTVRPKIAVMRQSAADAGRDPSEIEITMMGSVLAGHDRATLDEVIARQAAARGMDVSVFRNRLDKNEVLYGTTDEIATKLDALEAVGVQRIYLQWFDLTDLEGIEEVWEAMPE